MTPDWQSECGTVQLYCGDCAEILPHIGKVDAVVTDPPYEIVASGGGLGALRKDLIETTGFTDCGFSYSMLEGFENWVVFGTLKQVPKLFEVADKRRVMLITWNKPNPSPLCGGNYLPDTEYIVHAWSRGGLHGTYEDKAMFIVHPIGDKEDGTHPNEKPVTVMNKMVRLASAEGHTILDPFMGSGTTGVAAVRLGRKFIGIEKEPKYFEIAKRRIMDALGMPVSNTAGEVQLRLFAKGVSP